MLRASLGARPTLIADHTLQHVAELLVSSDTAHLSNGPDDPGVLGRRTNLNPATKFQNFDASRPLGGGSSVIISGTLRSTPKCVPLTHDAARAQFTPSSATLA